MTNEELWQRASKVIPQGASSGHRVGWPFIVEKTTGAYLWDTSGKKYLDFLSAFGAIIIGHSDRRVNDAVYQAVNTCDLNGIGPQPGEVELAEQIVDIFPSADKVAFCTSGTDAAMHAVQMARGLTGRYKIIKFHGAYHGWSDHVAVGGARNDTTIDSPLNQVNSAGLHPGLTDDVVIVEWNDADGLRQAFADHKGEIAAVITEGYIHSFGAVPPVEGFPELMRSLCIAEGSLLILDEIKTGFRAALGGIQSIYNYDPDITVFGKAVANGYSLAGIAGKASAMDGLGAYEGKKMTIDGTYNASPYAIAAARKTLEILVEDDVHTRLNVLGDRLRSGIQEIIDDQQVPLSVSGIGSSWCLYFAPEAPMNFREALAVDKELYGQYHAAQIKNGIIETSFHLGDRRMNASTTTADIDQTLEKIALSIKEVKF